MNKISGLFKVKRKIKNVDVDANNIDGLGSLIKILRSKKGWNQKELAEALHVSDKAVSRWETGNSRIDLEMIYEISNLFNFSFNSMLKLRVQELDGIDTVEITKELEKHEKRYKNLLKKILILGLFLIIFLIMMIFFVANFNKFKVYDVNIDGNKIYNTDGIYLDTNIQDILYLGTIKIDDKNYNPETASADLYYLKDEEEIMLYHFMNIDTNIEIEISKLYYDIENLEEYFDGLYLRISVPDKDNNIKRYDAKLKFFLRFMNNKLTYLKKDKNESDRKVSDIKNNSNKILKKLNDLGFELESENKYIKKVNDETYSYDLREKKLILKNDNDGISNSYTYLFDYDVLEVSTTNKENNLVTVLEKYNYDIKNDKVDCYTGACLNYKEVLKIMQKYIDEFKIN